MFPSILTAIFFAASGVCGRRAAVHYGALRGNVVRLALALVVLGVASLLAGWPDWGTAMVRRLLLSGVVGFGVGDVALFLGYRWLGARLTLLVNLSSAPIFGATLDYVLNGTVPSAPQAAAGAVIVAGVVLALWSGQGRSPMPGARPGAGVVAALVAGFGQGCGAALTRFAKAVAPGGMLLPSWQEAFVRVIPGLGFSLAMWLLVDKCFLSSRRQPAFPSWRSAAGAWTAGAALFGPVLGVSCFQWALSSAPGAVVLSVTAMTPVLVIPLIMWVEGDRPGYAAVAGAFVAVAGVVWMGLLAPA